MIFDNDIMNYAGYRNMLVENKIDECLAKVAEGYDSISVEADDLSDEEIAYVESEVRRRYKERYYCS